MIEVGWLQFGLAVIIFLGGCFGVALRIGFIVANTVNKITLETDAKIGRVYERFDSYKSQLENNFVRTESCRLTHNSTASQLSDLKNSVEKIDDKVDAILLRMPQFGH